jgi:hypothetical protein
MAIVHIGQLAYPCVTRVRGEEAATKLQRQVGINHIEVDLSGVDMVSLSFLDGLISHFLRLGKETDFIFKIDTPILEEKLARVAGIRNTTIHFHYDEKKIRRIKPKFSRPQKPVFIPTKEDFRQ